MKQLEFETTEFKVDVSQKLPTMREVMVAYVDFAIEKNKGMRDRTAKEIGIDRKTLYRWAGKKK